MLRITDAQWELIWKHFPEEHYPDERPGRKAIPARKVLEAVLSILNTGAQWRMLPQFYPDYETVDRRFQQRCQREVVRAALTELANARCAGRVRVPHRCELCLCEGLRPDAHRGVGICCYAQASTWPGRTFRYDRKGLID